MGKKQDTLGKLGSVLTGVGTVGTTAYKTVGDVQDPNIWVNRGYSYMARPLMWGDTYQNIKNDYAAYRPLTLVNKKDMGFTHTNGLFNTLKASGAGASAGSAFGGWGALAGGIIGGLAGGLGWIFGNNKAKKAVNKVNSAYLDINDYNQRMFPLRYYNTKDEEEQQLAYNAYSNRGLGYARGGLISDLNSGVLSPFGNRFANGGLISDPLHSNGSDWSNGFIYIGTGGSHAENPNGGVLVSVDLEGTPNLLEEGEVMYKSKNNSTWAYSTELLVPKEDKKALGIKGGKNVTYADAMLKRQKVAGEMPYDPIELRGMEDFAMKLAQSQENTKQVENMLNYLDMQLNYLLQLQDAFYAACGGRLLTRKNKHKNGGKVNSKKESVAYIPYYNVFDNGGLVNLFATGSKVTSIEDPRFREWWFDLNNYLERLNNTFRSKKVTNPGGVGLAWRLDSDAPTAQQIYDLAMQAGPGSYAYGALLGAYTEAMLGSPDTQEPIVVDRPVVTTETYVPSAPSNLELMQNFERSSSGGTSKLEVQPVVEENGSKPLAFDNPKYKEVMESLRRLSKEDRKKFIQVAKDNGILSKDEDITVDEILELWDNREEEFDDPGIFDNLQKTMEYFNAPLEVKLLQSSTPQLAEEENTITKVSEDGSLEGTVGLSATKEPESKKSNTNLGRSTIKYTKEGKPIYPAYVNNGLLHKNAPTELANTFLPADQEYLDYYINKVRQDAINKYLEEHPDDKKLKHFVDPTDEYRVFNPSYTVPSGNVGFFYERNNLSDEEYALNWKDWYEGGNYAYEYSLLSDDNRLGKSHGGKYINPETGEEVFEDDIPTGVNPMDWWQPYSVREAVTDPHTGELHWDMLPAQLVLEAAYRAHPERFDFYPKDREEPEEPAEMPGYGLSGLRFFPGVAGIFPVFSDLLGESNVADFRGGNAIRNQIPMLDVPPYQALLDFISTEPFAEDYYLNQDLAEAGANRRGLLGTVGGNRAAAAQQLLTLDLNNLNKIGELKRAALEYNRKDYLTAREYNKKSKEFDTDSAFKYAQLMHESKKAQLEALARAIAMDEAELNTTSLNRSTNWDNFVNNIGALGEDAWNYRMFKMLENSGYFGTTLELANRNWLDYLDLLNYNRNLNYLPSITLMTNGQIKSNFIRAKGGKVNTKKRKKNLTY